MVVIFLGLVWCVLPCSFAWGLVLVSCVVLVVIDCGLFDFGCFCCFGFPVVGCDLGLVGMFWAGQCISRV